MGTGLGWPPRGWRICGGPGQGGCGVGGWPDAFDLRDCTDYGAPVVRVGPVPFFVEGADNVCPVWWQGGLSGDDVPEAVGDDAEEVGGEVVVCLRREAVVAWNFVLPETVDGLPDFVDGEGAPFQLHPLGMVEDRSEAVDFGLGVRVECVLGGRVMSEPEPKHTHTHHTPQPGVAGYKQSGRTSTHTAQHPSQEWRGAAKTRAQAHTPTPHTQARSGGVQAERAHEHTHTPTPQPGVAGRS